MDESKLQLVLDYNMDEIQSKAFKVALLWEYYASKEFPNYKIIKLPKKGDPRKSSLFKYCYKMVRDFKGLIEDNDLKLFVIAQLQILKAHPGALVQPNCLAGNGAWKRWQVWKRRYDIINNKPAEVEAQPVALPLKLKGDLERTKDFIISKYGKLPSVEDLERNISDGTLFRWVFLSKISPYYMILSEEFNEAINNKKIDVISYFKIDLGVYKTNVTNEVKMFFQELFK